VSCDDAVKGVRPGVMGASARTGRRAAALAGIVSLAACVHAVPGAATPPREALLHRQASFLEVLAARDADRAALYFAEDAVLHISDRPPVEGRDAIREFYSGVFRFLAASTSTTQHVSASRGGDMAYATGRVVNVFAGQQGQMQFTGKYLLVWERRAGEWYVVAYTLSSDSRR
jgi:ketosteroid isomerase-like protein